MRVSWCESFLAGQPMASSVTPRIALFLRTLGGGGAERAHINLARGLVDLGFQVDLVLSSGQDLGLWEIPPGVRVVDFKDPKVSASLPHLIRYLRQERPAALIPTLHYAIEVAIVAKLLARVPTKVLVPEQNNPAKDVMSEQKPYRRLLIPIFMRVLYPFADAVVGVSHGVATGLAQLSGLPLERIQVIFNPAIFPGLQEKAQEPIDHPWFKPGEHPVILGVGRLQEQKDFPTLIRAFAKVRQACPSRLVILGYGPDRPQLEALVQELGITEDVDMSSGFVKNPFPYMKKASVFVLSSAWEGMSNVIIEALAVGTQVVSTNCKSGPAEILDHGKYGALVPVGDSDGLADAILDVLNGHFKPVDSAWLNQFTLKAITQQYLELLDIPVTECSTKLNNKENP
jgi:glycosyltransferase involved in cell wall biosynthesis